MLVAYHGGSIGDDEIGQETSWKDGEEYDMLLRPAPIERIFGIIRWLRDEDSLAILRRLQFDASLASFVVAGNLAFLNHDDAPCFIDFARRYTVRHLYHGFLILNIRHFIL
jgi:hypothetical protein